MRTRSGTKTGKLIRTARIAAGISQLELARELDVHVSTIRRLENDWRVPTAIEVAAIVRVLQMEAAWAEWLIARAVPRARPNGLLSEPELSNGSPLEVGHG
jgi:transcriptional regulator with XRE-family HTH domain